MHTRILPPSSKNSSKKSNSLGDVSMPLCRMDSRNGTKSVRRSQVSRRPRVVVTKSERSARTLDRVPPSSRTLYWYRGTRSPARGRLPWGCLILQHPAFTDAQHRENRRGTSGRQSCERVPSRELAALAPLSLRHAARMAARRRRDPPPPPPVRRSFSVRSLLIYRQAFPGTEPPIHDRCLQDE